ncbi:MAG: RNase A-like domain-containing protein [Hyphomicrobiaceae bacterium]
MPLPDSCPDCQKREAALLELRSGLTYIKFLVTDLRLHLALKAGFNQDQPRDDHGRWSDTGGGTRIAQDERAERYSVRLPEDEARGGHAIRTHVGKGDAELLATLRAMRIDTPFVTIAAPAQGSFASLESANDFVNRVLEAHAPMVDMVASGAMKEVWLEQRFGYPTGKEAFRPDAFAEPYMRSAYEVGVLIRQDTRSQRGYTVITAYPLNARPKN